MAGNTSHAVTPLERRQGAGNALYARGYGLSARPRRPYGQACICCDSADVVVSGNIVWRLVFAGLLGAISAAALWIYRRQPQANKRRIAAAPALALGFISQLFFSEVSSLLQSL